MRPIHALLLILVLAGVLVGALLLVQSDADGDALVRPGTSQTDGADVSRSALDGPLTPDDGGADRTKVTPTPVTAQKNGRDTFTGIRGRVVDPEARPVAGATVYASNAAGPSEMPLDELDPSNFWSKRVQTTTDAEGRFTLESPASGAVRVAVRAAGFAPLDAQKASTGVTTDVGDLALERGVVLMGRVVDVRNRPVEGAQVRRVRQATGGFVLQMGSNNSGPVVATTDSSGAFRVDQMPAGPWTLLVTSEKHPDKTAKGETDRPGQVVADVIVRLDAGYDVAGRLVGAPADMMEQLTVRASPNAATGNEPVLEGLSGVRHAKVQKDGTFVVGGCREGQTYRLVARQKEHSFGGGARSDTAEAKAGDGNVVLQYRSETALVFQVVDLETGKGVESLSVEAGYKWLMPLLEEGTMRNSTRFPEGRVRFASLQAPASDSDTAQLRIESQGYERYERRDLRVVAGIDNDLGVIHLKRAALVRVTVLDQATNAPVAGARVTLNELSPSGSQRGITFGVNLADDDGQFGRSGAHTGITDAQGIVTLSSMPGKRATLSVSHKGHARFTSAPIELPGAGDHDETLRLKAGGTVVVQVVDAAKQPVPGLAIDHRVGDDTAAGMITSMPDDTVTDARGEVVFTNLPEGKHLFRVRSGNGGMMSFGSGAVMRRARVTTNGAMPDSDQGWNEAVVVEAQSITVTLVAPARGTLTGRVRESGKPLVGAKVRLKPKDDDSPDMGFFDEGASAVTNASGEYVLEGQPTGDCGVTVTHPSRAMPWRGETSLREGSNRLDVELSVAIVEGTITGEDQKPIAGVKVRAERARAEDGDKEVRTVVMMTSDSDGEAMNFTSGAGAPPVTTDSEGRYRLRGLTPGVAFEIVASAAGAQTSRSEPLELAADQTRTGVDLVLKLGATVQVITRRPDGKPASGLIVHAVSVESSESEPKTQFVGATGRVTFNGLQPGRWRFTCDRPGFGDGGGNEAKIPDQEIEVKVGTPGSVTFDVPG